MYASFMKCIVFHVPQRYREWSLTFHLQFRVFTLFGVTILRLTVRQFDLTILVNTVVLTTKICNYRYVATTRVV